MFYVLDFEKHEFISCNNASIAEASLRNLLASGVPVDSVEVINGWTDGSRLSVQEFRTLCKDLELLDASLDNISSLPGFPKPENEQDIRWRGYESADTANYPQYPHDFGNGYKIQTFYANLLPIDWINEVGSEFDTKENAEAEYPDHDIVVGFHVVCEIDGHDYFPADCDVFCKSIQDAISLYEEKIQPTLSANNLLSKPSLAEQIQSASSRPSSIPVTNQTNVRAVVQPSDKAPIFLFEENLSGNRMGKPGDANNAYYASWFKFYSFGPDLTPRSEGLSLNFKDPTTYKPVSGGNGISEVDVIESFRKANPGRSVVMLSIEPYKGSLEVKMNQALQKFKEDGQSLLSLPPFKEQTKQDVPVR